MSSTDPNFLNQFESIYMTKKKEGKNLKLLNWLLVRNIPISLECEISSEFKVIIETEYIELLSKKSQI
jgi:hypothetical protein